MEQMIEIPSDTWKTARGSEFWFHEGVLRAMAYGFYYEIDPANRELKNVDLTLLHEGTTFVLINGYGDIGGALNAGRYVSAADALAFARAVVDNAKAEEAIYDDALATLEDSFRGWLYSHDLDVMFTKADGTDRLLRCTLRELALPPREPEEEGAKPKRKKKPGHVTVWSLNDEAWRSFNLDTVKKVEILKNAE